MLIVISPAKRLETKDIATAPTGTPQFQDQAELLAETARDLSTGDLKKLMGISDALATLNHDRFRDFGTMTRAPAALTFAGDAYAGLEAATMTDDEMRWAGHRLRILSGLYGLLAPLDGIEPYRLEMGSRLKNPRGRNLYDFWGPRIARALNDQAHAMGTDTLINCASQEYFKAVAPDALNLRVITPTFLEMRPTGPKTISFFAKKARGSMARFIIQNRLTDPASLCDFDLGGYQYQPDRSTPDCPVFLRDA